MQHLHHLAVLLNRSAFARRHAALLDGDEDDSAPIGGVDIRAIQREDKARAMPTTNLLKPSTEGAHACIDSFAPEADNIARSEPICRPMLRTPSSLHRGHAIHLELGHLRRGPDLLRTLMSG